MLKKGSFSSAARSRGITLVGNLFTKNLDVKGKADAFELFIETFLGGDTTGDFVSSLFSVLKDAFIVDLLLCLVNTSLKRILTHSMTTA